MEWKTPTGRTGRGLEMLAGASDPSITLAAYRAQHLAARFALPIEQAAMIATLAFAHGGAHHG
jgi:hypothetical protein